MWTVTFTGSIRTGQIEIPGKPHAEGRNQRILDLGRREVQEYIIASMTKVFSSAPVSYVKWDMNRTFSDYYSQSLPAAQQGEVAHRYVLGLYRCMEELTRRFPEILFEGCAAGGNRFDPGILCYFPQIWGSDDTDACCRADIQTNYSYGYPLSTVSAHVSACPNHQTLRRTPLTTRFAVAAFAVLGYECNFCDCTREELEEIRAQIALYRKWRSVLQQGIFYRGRTFADGNLTESDLCFRRSDTGSRHADAETCGTEYTVSRVLSQRTCKRETVPFYQPRVNVQYSGVWGSGQHGCSGTYPPGFRDTSSAGKICKDGWGNGGFLCIRGCSDVWRCTFAPGIRRHRI